jgi:transcription elongation factor Elf1
VSAHALCRCGEAGGTAHCPVHGSQYPQKQTLPVVRCSVCGTALQTRWDTGMAVDDRYLAVSTHLCPSGDVRVVDARELSDAQIVAEVQARGL